MEVNKFYGNRNEDLITLNGVFVKATGINELFELAQELGEHESEEGIIQIDALIELYHLSDHMKKELKMMKIGEIKEFYHGLDGYKVRRVSEHFCTAQILLLECLFNDPKVKVEATEEADPLVWENLFDEAVEEKHDSEKLDNLDDDLDREVINEEDYRQCDEAREELTWE